MSFVKERLRFFVLTGQVACGLFDQLAVKYSNRVKVNSKNKKNVENIMRQFSVLKWQN